MSVRGIVTTGRRLAATTLLDRAYISDRTVASDSAGGQNVTYVERTRPVACRFSPLLDKDPEMVAGSVYGPPQGSVYFRVGTVIPEGSKIRNAANGRMWVVIAERTPDSEVAVIARFLVRED